ncbi:MAG TPA: hypothetical protein IGS53_01860 [Leptolyngbyaceae cyanobacterium M33_DOE_097]|uniref:Tetratricopeptide repeat protein n=1 Tax=Oscillatoriales cyanobacterium SpSt-418 TaxID=2282169 RepID=A0A7C3PU60_9CYAN|nr:hypothetical protein [Leptolyngbyaceae cyanobacterium M33_DOE_097]
MIRYLILAVVTFCLSVTTFATPVPPATLNSEGFYWLDKGNATTALEKFRKAEAAYQQAGHSEGMIGTKANQIIALRRLGRLEEACELAAQTFTSTCWATVLPSIPSSPSPAQAALLQGFVETLTDQKRFDRAIELFEQVPAFLNSASALFSGGNIYLEVAKSQQNLDASSRALESGRRYLADALARANESHDKTLQLFAQASLLNLAGLEQQQFKQATQIPSISIDALQELAVPDQERVALLLAEGWGNLDDPQAKQVLPRAIASQNPAIKSRALLQQFSI